MTGSETGDFAEIRDSMAAVFSDPAVEPGFDIVVLLDDTTYRPDEQAVRRIAGMLKVLCSQLECRIVLVASAMGLVTPTTLAAVFANSHARAFDTVEEAHRWLDSGS